MGRDRAFAERRGQMTLPDSGLKSKGWASLKSVLRVRGVLGPAWQLRHMGTLLGGTVG